MGDLSKPMDSSDSSGTIAANVTARDLASWASLSSVTSWVKWSKIVKRNVCCCQATVEVQESPPQPQWLVQSLPCDFGLSQPWFEKKTYSHTVTHTHIGIKTSNSNSNINRTMYFTTAGQPISSCFQTAWSWSMQVQHRLLHEPVLHWSVPHPRWRRIGFFVPACSLP